MENPDSCCNYFESKSILKQNWKNLAKLTIFSSKKWILISIQSYFSEFVQCVPFHFHLFVEQIDRIGNVVTYSRPEFHDTLSLLSKMYTIDTFFSTE